MPRTALLSIVMVTLLQTGISRAVDGVIEINQAKAAAGGINGSLTTDPAGFPVVISQPGSYRLTGPLSVPEFQGAISITADGVTLDLNGFRITAELPAGAVDGISAAGRTGIRVSNGTIEGFGGAGITAGDRARIENVTARNNTGGGISVGAFGQVLGCTVHGNGNVLQASDGIFAGAVSLVSGSTAVGNSAAGIHVLGGSLVNGNTAYDNRSRGLFVGEGSTVKENSVTSNAGDGITTDAACTVLHNTVRNNTGDGIEVGNSSAVIGNSVSGNSRCGLHASGSCAVTCLYSAWAHNVLGGNNGGPSNRQVFSNGLLQMSTTGSGDVDNTNVCSGSQLLGGSSCGGGAANNCP